MHARLGLSKCVHTVTVTQQSLKMSQQPCTDAMCKAALLDMYSCIVDYCCRYRHLDVIYEISQHMNQGLSTLAIPHLRLGAASLYKMVVCDNVTQYHTALQLAQCLFEAAGTFSNGRLVCCYTKLLCGLKVKALLHCLQRSPKEAFLLLRKYFPPGGQALDQQLTLHNTALAKEMRQVSQDFRKSFLHLVSHKERRENFFSSVYSEAYNRRFSHCLVQRAASFLTELEKGLPDTFLDELLRGRGKENQPVNTPTMWDVLMEVLLGSVEGKRTLRSVDLLSLLKDLHSVCAPHQHDIRYGVKCIRLLSSSDSLSASSGSQSSHNSNGTPADSSSTMPHHRVQGRLDQEVETISEGKVTDCDTSHLTDKTSASPKSRSDDPGKSRTCQGCQQSKRIRLSALRPHRYCGQHGTYVAPACHVRLSYRQTYQDSSGTQHPLFI